MKLNQISLFLENKPGTALDACRVLAKENIDIRALSIADTEEFGILRLIVSDWQKGAAVLRDAGFVTNVTEVVGVEVPDRPGGLYELLELFEGSRVNIDYMYAMTFRDNDQAVLVFRFDNTEKAIDVLCKAGINVLAAAEVHK